MGAMGHGLAVIAAASAVTAACDRRTTVRDRSEPPAARPAPPATTPDRRGLAPDWDRLRARMVDEQIVGRGVADRRVLAAMRTVPRHEFVPDADARAYDDGPLPIGLEQTISQPYIVAAMTELARLDADERVLEIGTGSGYQAAVLAEVAGEVYSIEIVPELAERAAATLTRLGYTAIHLRTGDGYRGWPEAAPFDAIVVTAAPPEVPRPLVEQLAPGGRMVIPVGDEWQELRVLTRTDDGITDERVFPVAFVPMTGRAQER